MYNNNTDYSNQNLYNQNSYQNNLIQNEQPQQPYYVGQPIVNNGNNYNNNNMNYNNQQNYPPQAPQMQQPIYNQQQNPVIIMNGEANLINMQYASPEIIYCTAPIRSTQKRYNNGVGVSGIITALRQIYSEMNLNFVNLYLIGIVNLLSTSSIEQKVIQQIININPSIQAQQIRNGKVVQCCNILSKNIKKSGFILLTIQFITTIMLATGYSIDGNHTNKSLLAPYMVHISLWFLQFVFALAGLLKCRSRLLSIGLLFAIITLFYGIAVISISNFITFGSDDPSNGLGLRLGIQIPAFILGVVSFITFSGVQTQLKRLLILTKQLEETEFMGGCCV